MLPNFNAICSCLLQIAINCLMSTFWTSYLDNNSALSRAVSYPLRSPLKEPGQKIPRLIGLLSWLTRDVSAKVGCCCAMAGQTICGDHMGTKSMYSPRSLNVYPTYNPAPHNILNRPMGKVLQLFGDDVESMLIAPNKLSMKKMLVECW